MHEASNTIRCFAEKVRAEEPFKIYVAIKSHYHPSPPCRKTFDCLSTNLIGHYYIPSLVNHRVCFALC